MEHPLTYRSTVGALQYLNNTRPDIAYILNHLSQFLKQPTDIYWQAVKRVLRYLSGMRHLGLHITPGSDLSLTAYSDVDWC